MSIELPHLIGIFLTLALIIGVGIYSGTRVHGEEDFSGGGHSAGSWIVCGAILGALVGGQSTVGTAQLAYLYGLSAWWFTLGSGIGCLFMAIFYVGPMRRTGKTTVMSVISGEYGHRAEYLGSVLSSIGIVISIISNVVAGSALMMTVLNISLWTSLVITVVLMVIYVIFGGVWGAGMGGIVKLILLYFVSIFGLILVMISTGGLGGLLHALDQTLLESDLGQLYELAQESAIRRRYMNLFSRGSSDFGSALSLLLGVLSTQTYAQAAWAASSDSTARKGTILSACLAPPIGIAGIAIGMFMRNHAITVGEMKQLAELGLSIPQGRIVLESTAQIFPAFILHFMPRFLGGIALGTLLITIVAGGAGLALGVSTILVENIFAELMPGKCTGHAKLVLNRTIIVVVLVGTAIIAGLASHTLINDLGFLSMGLRGAVVFLPFTCALFLPGKIHPTAMVCSIILGPIAVILGNLLGINFPPLAIGLLINMICVLVGFLMNRRQTHVF